MSKTQSIPIPRKESIQTDSIGVPKTLFAGYNLFCSEQKKLHLLEPGSSSSNQMVTIYGQWKALSDFEKDVWQAKAKHAEHQQMLARVLADDIDSSGVDTDSDEDY